MNAIIGCIGSSPINSLDNLQNVDAINALRILRATSRREQARGWSFNIEPNFILSPDVFSKRIPFLDSYLFIKAKDDKKYVNSGGYVKELTTGATKFDSPITVEAVLLEDFETLPLPMQTYIIAKSSYLFQARYFGDETLTKNLLTELQEAWQILISYEVDNNDYNLLNHSNVQNVLSR